MRKMGLSLAIVGVVVVLLVLSPIGKALIWFVHSQRDIAAREAQVAAPGTYQPVAKALAQLCQSDPSFFVGEGPFPPAWAPVEVLGLKPTWVEVASDGAHIEFGGGFHHFGYRLERNAGTSTETTNQWDLTFYSEDKPDKSLYHFSMAKSEHIELPTLIVRAMAEYDRRATAYVGYVDARDVVALVGFLLHHRQEALLVGSVHDFAARHPHDWLDQLLAFLIDGPGEPAAQQRLEAWASRENDFTSWMFAAYGYDAAGDADGAEKCVKKAVAATVNEPSWVQSNARARGAPMCLRLYAAGRYAVCVSLCDALLGYRKSGDYLAAELRGIRDAAQRASQGELAANLNAPRIEHPLDPFEGLNLTRIMAMAATRPATTQADQ